MIIYFFEIPLVLILMVVILAFGGLELIREHMTAFAVIFAVAAGACELEVFGKLIEHIEGRLVSPKHKLLDALYWLIVFIPNIANSVVVVIGTCKAFMKYAEQVEVDSFFNFVLDFIIIMPFVYLIYFGAIWLNHKARTFCFEDDKFACPGEASVFIMIFQSIATLAINGVVFFLTSAFLKKLF